MSGFSPLWQGGPVLAQSDGVFPLGTDSVLLADFSNTSGAKRAFDLGCGSGALCVLLLARAPGLSFDGIEILPEASGLARNNLEANGWDSSGIITGDLRDHRKLFKPGTYDLVVCNPPYFPTGSGGIPDHPSRAGARSESCCTLMDICSAAAYLCRNGGSLCLVHRPERLADVFRSMSRSGLEPKRLRFVSHKAVSAPNLVLIDGRRNAKPGLVIEPPLILCKPDGSDSEEFKKIYHMD